MLQSLVSLRSTPCPLPSATPRISDVEATAQRCWARPLVYCVVLYSILYTIASVPKDYYATLGVDKNASPEEVKTAFRRLAHQHHPDKKGGDEGKFKEINEAYQVLSDTDKRKRYDQYGSADGFQGFHPGQGFGQGVEFDMGDLGSVFEGVGEMFGFGGGARGQQQARSRKGQDLEITLTVSFQEMALGATKEFELKKMNSCSECTGSGVAKGSSLETCTTCKGRGQVVTNRRTIFGQFQTATVCPECRGEGKIPKQKCARCRGEGRELGARTISVKIPGGISDGDTMRLTGEGDAAEKGGRAGDLYVHIRVKPDARWEREGNDVVSAAAVTFSQAALGTTVSVETIDGAVDCEVPQGIQSGQRLKIRGKGIAKLNASGRGDHLVAITVNTPKHISRKARELLEKLKEEGI